MHKRIDVGTDIAKIGVWDPACERHDLRTARYADYEAGLQAEARAGRLFFVNTGADGEYPIDLYVDEEPPVADLQLYTLREGEFLICSQSGRLMAGGLEDFVSDTKQNTSEEDHLEVAPGMYALSVYELQEEEFDKRLPEFIGPEDYAYYQSKFVGFSWGCLLFVLAAGLSLTRYWIAAVGLFALWLAYLFVRSVRRGADERFQEIADRIEVAEYRFPPFIFVLRTVTERGDLEGGWYDLN